MPENLTRPDIHGAIVRSLTDAQRERLRGIDLTNIADAVIQELGNVVNEGGTWGVIDLLIEIAGPRCTADEGNHP